ncbi:MAG: radical SAM protein [Leptospirales bacterium]
MSTYKILLIHPEGHETFWQLNGITKIIRKKSASPPLSLATVAALVPEGFEVEIIDETIEDINFDTECDMVGITGFTMHSLRMAEIAREFRKKGKLLVAGGPYITGHQKEAAELFDVLICGEAEEVWPQFLEDWKTGKYKPKYHGAREPDISNTPVPRYDLLKMEHYSSGMVQTSRGCPFDCDFCDVISLFGRKSRYKSIENVLAEIENLASHKKFDIFFADDNFIGNPKYAKKLLREIIRTNNARRRPLRFNTQATVNIAKDDELLDLLVEANFYSVFLGIETPSEASLKETNKGQNVKVDIKEAVRKIQSRGIYVSAGMIVGFDSDDIKIFDLQYEFLTSAGITITLLGMLNALKGTRLWDRLEKEGRLHPELETGDPCLDLNFDPKLMTRDELMRNYGSLFKKLYTPEHFFERFSSLIDQIDVKKVKKSSPLKVAMQLKNMRRETLWIIYGLFKFYIFNKDKAMRKLFWRSLKKGLGKTTLSLPWIIELLLYFKAQNEFTKGQFPEVAENEPYYTVRSSTKPVAVPH